MVFLRQSVDPVNTHRHVSRAQPAKVSRAQPAKAMAQDRRHGRPRPPAEPKSHPRPENDGRPPPRIKTTDGRPGGGRPPPELEALRLTDGHFSGRPSAPKGRPSVEAADGRPPLGAAVCRNLVSGPARLPAAPGLEALARPRLGASAALAFQGFCAGPRVGSRPAVLGFRRPGALSRASLKQNIK